MERQAMLLEGWGFEPWDIGWIFPPLGRKGRLEVEFNYVVNDLSSYALSRIPNKSLDIEA